jgi:nucleotide-binding universal stress UspA family protein
MNSNRVSASAARKTEGREAHTHPLKALAVVDGSERTGRLLEFLVGMAAMPVEVVVLNVQPAPEDWRLRGYLSFKSDEVWDRLVNDLGAPIVKNFGLRLSEAGIAHIEVVKLGTLTESVLDCRREEGCSMILVTEAAPGPMKRWLLRTFRTSFRSTAAELVQLAEVPVVVVR